MQILKPDDPAWHDLYMRLPDGQRDVFYSPGYAKACAVGLYANAKVQCAAQEANDSIILYPFVERDLAPMAPWSIGAQSLRDVTGLYGRGGIACNRLLNGGELGHFHAQLDEHLRDRQVISRFDRYHPVTRNERCAAATTEVRQIGDFVIVPLTADMSAIEANYKVMRRRNLRKAERADVQISFEKSTDHLDDFLKVYSQTMKRNAADAFYYFDRRFYEALVEHLPDNTVFAYATCQEEIVSCDLILIEPPFAHLFLSGTPPQHLEKSPNTRLKHETFRYLKQLGCEHYLLGGGHKPEDGVFRYKLSFAPKCSVPSFIGCTVYLRDEYESLRQEFADRHGQLPNGRFQFYDAA